MKLGQILDDEIFTLVHFGHFSRLDVLTMTYKERDNMFNKLKEIKERNNNDNGVPLHTISPDAF